MRLQKKIRLLLLASCAAFAAGSCNEDQLYNNVVLEASIQAAEQTVVSNLTLEYANIRISSITVEGLRNENESVFVQKEINPLDGTFHLVGKDSNQPVRLSLNPGKYDSLMVVLQFLPDDYQLNLQNIPDPPAEDKPDTDGNGDNEESPSSEDDRPADSGDDGSGGNENSNDGNDAGGQDSDDDEEDEDDSDEDDDDAEDDDDNDNNDSEDRDGNDDEDGDDDGDDKDNDRADGEPGKDGNKGKSDKDKKSDKKEKNKGKGSDDKKGKKGGRSGQVAGVAVDLAGFFANAKPSLYASFVYRNGPKTIRVLVSVDNLSQLHFKTPGKSYALSAMYGNSATATFDMQEWFRNISNAALESAVIIPFEGENVLLIHRQLNTALYERIIASIPGSSALVVSLSESDM